MNSLRQYLTLGAVIIGPLPVTLMDGQIADAVPVMANFNWIVSQVNANSASALNFSYMYVVQGLSGVGVMSTGSPQIQLVTAGTPTVVFDSNTEFTASNGRFTAKNAGAYRSTFCASINSGGVTYSGDNQCYACKNGATGAAVTLVATMGPTQSVGGVSTGLGVSDGIVQLAAGDFLNGVVLPRFSGGSAITLYVAWTIQRVA